MNLDETLNQALERWGQNHLRRKLRPMARVSGVRVVLEGRECLNFSSNDYLGLAQHPAVVAAAMESAREHGAGAGASRLICGSLPPHQRLEEALADFEGREAALSFSTGYATAVGVVPALVGPGDIVILDRLAHASLVDGARLSRARLRVFRHNDTGDLRRILKWAADRRRGADGAGVRILVITEGVFSMDGDRAPLSEMAALTREHGAWLMVDEAHATGLIGPGRRGVAEDQGVPDAVEVSMGTLSKALGASGGFVTGSRALRDYLVQSARSFMFSTAPSPAAAGAAVAALGIVKSDEGARLARRVWDLVEMTRRELLNDGWRIGGGESAILPIEIGPEAEALRLADALLQEGMFVPAIRYPTVARGKARLRVTLSAAHRDEDVGRLLEALRKARKALPAPARVSSDFQPAT
jgi:8-amino-7-oxononanoate synthase